MFRDLTTTPRLWLELTDLLECGGDRDRTAWHRHRVP
jgi:hypothetical protein